MSTDAPRLLIVDDNDDNRYTLRRRFKRLGEGHFRAVPNSAQ